MKKIIIVFLISYAILSIYNWQLANFLLTVIVLGFVLFLVSRKVLAFLFDIFSVITVSKKFVVSFNKLKNSKCTVTFTPFVNILVSENVPNNFPKKRIFKYMSCFFVNSAWYNICSLFDECTTLDLLSEFLSPSGKINIEEVNNDAYKQNVPVRNLNLR